MKKKKCTKKRKREKDVYHKHLRARELKTFLRGEKSFTFHTDERTTSKNHEPEIEPSEKAKVSRVFAQVLTLLRFVQEEEPRGGRCNTEPARNRRVQRWCAAEQGAGVEAEECGDTGRLGQLELR